MEKKGEMGKVREWNCILLVGLSVFSLVIIFPGSFRSLSTTELYNQEAEEETKRNNVANR